MESRRNNEIDLLTDDGNNIQIAKLLRNSDEVQRKRNKINLQISVKYVLPEQYCSL